MTIKRFIAANGLDGNSKTITGLIDPVNATDAVTKQFAANATNLTAGTVPASVMPAYTGDATSSAGSIGLTLATVNPNVGAFGSATAVPVITVNGKGLVTAVSTVSISGAITIAGDATGTGTTGATTTITLATVNSNITAVGSTSVVPVITANAKGLVTSITSATITPAAIGAVATTALGANSGVATLDSGGKLTSSQIPSSLVGSIVYQGTWNASTNSPAIPVASVGNKGYYYKVSVAGTTAIDGYSNWTLGDLIISDGAAWDNVQGGSSDVVSVSGRVGAITLTSTDVGLGNVTNVAQLASTQTLSVTGDVTTVSATSLSGGTMALTLASVGTAGTYRSVTTDSKGRVTSGTNPTTLAGYGITDAVSNTAGNNSIPLVNGVISSATFNTTSTTAAQVVDSNPVATYRSVKYEIQVTSGTSYQKSEAIVITDGTNASITEFGNINIGTITTSLASFDASVSGGNLQLLVTPAQATSTVYKVIKTLINI